MNLEVKYYAETDMVVITAGERVRSVSDLRNDGTVNVSYAEEDNEKTVTRVESFDISRNYLPLGARRGYDAATDTLTLGERPVDGYRVVGSGEFIGYWEWAKVEEQWEMAALDIRNASKHLRVQAPEGGERDHTSQAEAGFRQAQGNPVALCPGQTGEVSQPPLHWRGPVF